MLERSATSAPSSTPRPTSGSRRRNSTGKLTQAWCAALFIRNTHTVTKEGKTLGEAITNPVIVVEVLSPSTENRDQGEKFEAYKHISSLKEYVLVSQNERRIEVRRRGERGWSCDVAGPDDTIRIHGHEIAVGAIYR